jgi:Domain of unknown function (DUF3786)/Putative Fe-S cluster
MPMSRSPLDVYKLLPQTNCQKCYFPSCLAFAASVIKGEKSIRDCPDLDNSLTTEIVEKQQNTRTFVDREQSEKIKQLQTQISKIDFDIRSKQIGASVINDKLAIPCLGKQFFITTDGNITSECHINSWVTGPILDYTVNCQGVEPNEKWIPFRELPNGKAWTPLYIQRCEIPLKNIVDNQTELFEYLIDLFSGQTTKSNFDSDISIILYPLPKIPIQFCYWKPEDNMESMLNVFFDENAEENLTIESIYMLLAGLVVMFEKISLTHS